MYGELVNSILSQPRIDESESFGEEVQFAGENFIDEEENNYPYQQNENINNGNETWSYENQVPESKNNFYTQDGNELTLYETDFEEEDQYEDSSDELEEFQNDYGSTGEAYGGVSDMQIAEVIESQVASIKSSPAGNKLCEGHTCWAKNVLNQQLNLTLSNDDRLDEETKKALAAFQAKNNLPVTQKIDFVTERTLLETEALRRNTGTAFESAANQSISAAKTKIEDWTNKAVNNKPQHILNSYRDPRKVYAFVLHHMAFKRKGSVAKQFSDPTSYLSTGAHFCIMLDGRIIQLHPM